MRNAIQRISADGTLPVEAVQQRPQRPGQKRPVRKPARRREAESRHVLDALDRQRRKRLARTRAASARTAASESPGSTSNGSRAPSPRACSASGSAPRSSGSSCRNLYTGIRHRADVRLAHHDAAAGRQHAHRLVEEPARRRHVMEHVEQHQRADAAVLERQRLGAGFAVVPRRAHQVGQLDARDELAREARPRSELDPAAPAPAAAARRATRAYRSALSVRSARFFCPGPPVLLEPLQRARPQLVRQLRGHALALRIRGVTRT